MLMWENVKRRDLHHKWSHREANDNTLIILLLLLYFFTTMNNQNRHIL